MDQPGVLRREESAMQQNPIASLSMALALIVGGSSAVQAASPKTDFVREQALALVEGSLTPDQFTKLQVIAYQSAIANVCEGFTIDEAKFNKAFEALAPVDAARMSDDQKAYHDKHILVIFGVLVGGEFNAISDDISAACEDAAKQKADPDMLTDLVWQ
jgi:hypothetical protein